MSLQDRLTQDLKSSGPKTAILAVVTVVGLYFWVPPLWRMATRSDGSIDESAVSNAGLAGESTKAAGTEEEGDAAAPSSRLDWEMAERIRATDVLFRGAEPHELKHDAFTLSNDFLPIEVEFAVDPPPSEPEVAQAMPSAQEPGDGELENGDGDQLLPEREHGLTLQSTLVGGRGRKALINRQIYSEGDEVAVKGRVWKLTTVSDRTVVLQSESQTIELSIAPFELKQAQVER